MPNQAVRGQLSPASPPGPLGPALPLALSFPPEPMGHTLNLPLKNRSLSWTPSKDPQGIF